MRAAHREIHVPVRNPQSADQHSTMPYARQNISEAMDQPNLDPALLADDLRNLATLNRLFGGRSVLRKRLPALLRACSRNPVVLDIGSGAGDLCAEILAIGREQGRPIRLISLDYHPQVQGCAQGNLAREPLVSFVRGDARALPLPDSSVDLAICTLALHHFSEDDAVRVLAEMRRAALVGVLVSDLIRSRTAYAAVWLATRFMSNPMTRFDGPVSVGRAFTRGELLKMAAEAGWCEPAFVREGWFRGSLLLSPVPKEGAR